MVSGADILQVLIKMAEWQKIVALAEQVPELRARIEALEARARGPNSKFTCNICKAAMTVTGERDHPQFGVFGVKELDVVCNNPRCGAKSTREFDPAKP
jgi:hypothetical protein